MTTTIPTTTSTSAGPGSRSAELFARGREVLVDGVSSPSRGPLNFKPHPIFMARGAGAEIYDADGAAYVDLMLAYGALIHGHAHPELVESLREAAGLGALFATASEVEVDVAERICSMVACAEKVSFASTGTEAAMAALRLVRGFTGRQTIVKFEGHYHGWADAYSVSSNPLPPGAFGHPNDPIRIPDTSGVTPGSIQDTLVLPWNDVERLEAVLKARAGDIAAVITEPVMANMGVIPPAEGFLQTVRELTTRYGVLLYIDETVTGFRLGAGGAQERYGVTADITSFGKGLGAGLPVAALAGRSDIMSALSGGRILHYGTQNANPLLLAVVRRSLDLLTADENSAFTRLDQLAERLVAGLRDAIARTGAPALVQNAGAMLQVYFLRRGHESVESITGARDFGAHVDMDTFNDFAHLMFAQGVYLSPSPALHSVLSTVHTEEHVDRIVAAAGEAFAQIADQSR